VTTVALGVFCGYALAAEPAAQAAKPAPKVEVAFVLDTTGSMGGLIVGAKAKIWYIANQIVLAKPKPVVRMALVPYRDKGDEYVTKVFDLTDDIDQVYKDLMGFVAAGGGDGPENVNQALHDAVHKLSWSADRSTLKIIYLVGDWPPHNEYTDVPTYDKTAKAAIEKGIYVNTILCGTNAQAREVWQEIARMAEGTFLAIAQDGGVREVPTPYDAELAKLNAELSATVLAYGSREEQAKQTELLKVATSLAAPAAAERAAFAGASGMAAKNDLVADVAGGKVKLAEVEKDKLPEAMQKMSAAEQAEYLAKMQARRDEVNAQIKALSAKRAEHIRKELAEAAKSGAKEGFDLKVVESLRAQAAKKGLSYE